jgi:hypothetical protein
VVPPIPPVYGTAVKSSTMASTAACKTFTVAVLQLAGFEPISHI